MPRPCKTMQRASAESNPPLSIAACNVDTHSVASSPRFPKSSRLECSRAAPNTAGLPIVRNAAIAPSKSSAPSIKPSRTAVLTASPAAWDATSLGELIMLRFEFCHELHQTLTANGWEPRYEFCLHFSCKMNSSPPTNPRIRSGLRPPSRDRTPELVSLRSSIASVGVCRSPKSTTSAMFLRLSAQCSSSSNVARCRRALW